MEERRKIFASSKMWISAESKGFAKQRLRVDAMVSIRES